MFTIVPCNRELQHEFVGSVDDFNSMKVKSAVVLSVHAHFCGETTTSAEIGIQ